MSSAYFIVLDKSDPGFDTTVNGKFLAQEAKRLEKIARSLGLRTLDDYVSYSPDEARGMMEDLGMSPEEAATAAVPEEQWFAAQEGLDMVEKLAEHVRANPGAVKSAKGVLADLGEYREVFEKAKGIGARWHLQVDF